MLWIAFVLRNLCCPYSMCCHVIIQWRSNSVVQRFIVQPSPESIQSSCHSFQKWKNKTKLEKSISAHDSSFFDILKLNRDCWYIFFLLILPKIIIYFNRFVYPTIFTDRPFCCPVVIWVNSLEVYPISILLGCDTWSHVAAPLTSRVSSLDSPPRI